MLHLSKEKAFIPNGLFEKNLPRGVLTAAASITTGEKYFMTIQFQ